MKIASPTFRMIYSLGITKYRIRIRSVESELAIIIAALEMGNPSCKAQRTTSSLGKGGVQKTHKKKRKI